MALLLASCGGPDADAPGQGLVASSGQVKVQDGPVQDASTYAAARLLDQASWGPTPAAIEQVKRLGLAGWIDGQLSTPVTTLNAPNYVISFDSVNQQASRQANNWMLRRFYDVSISGADQLRQRVSWALYNYIPVNTQPYATIEYFNMLQRHSLGTYKDLLRAVSLNPAMGVFLNNDQNQATANNENFARELMQLFSVGLVMLNSDGSVQRTARGTPIETYTQRDVVQATKALTGWSTAWEPNLPTSNYMNGGKPMVPRQWPEGSHDTSAKTVLGRSMAAGQTVQQDLESLLDILVNHPNTAPFVSRRLIQSLVTSDPSADYMTRVVTVFRQSQGDLKQVVRAILLDPEARTADVIGQSTPKVGKIKEPMLHWVGTLRGLGCKAAVMQWNAPTEVNGAWTQEPYRAPNVFGYFSPGHKAPESLLASPEIRLLSGNEINRRLTPFNWWKDQEVQAYRDAGCEIAAFEAAARTSDTALLQLINDRFFRGTMSPTLKNGALNILKTELSQYTPAQRTGFILQLLLGTPSYGVVR